MKPEEMLARLNEIIKDATDEIGFGIACGYIRALTDAQVITIAEAFELREAAIAVYAA